MKEVLEPALVIGSGFHRHALVLLAALTIDSRYGTGMMVWKRCLGASEKLS